MYTSNFKISLPTAAETVNCSGTGSSKLIVVPQHSLSNLSTNLSLQKDIGFYGICILVV